MAGSYAKQFENTANADIHESTTGQEIIDDLVKRSWIILLLAMELGEQLLA